MDLVLIGDAIHYNNLFSEKSVQNRGGGSVRLVLFFSCFFIIAHGEGRHAVYADTQGGEIV